MPLRALARVNLAAIGRNVARLRSELHGSALCAVVKADGYGHGAVPAARAALAGGAAWLAVATAAEAAELRAAGIEAPILVLGAISAEELPLAIAARADLAVWSEPFVAQVRAQAGEHPVRLHIKLDTGLGRLGTRDRAHALAVAEAILREAPGLELAGAMTHFATADEDPEFVAHQLAEFRPFVAEIRRLAPSAVIHAANSAATLRAPESHFDMVRCGIAVYGGDPMNEDPAPLGLEPALELLSYVSAIKPAAPGQSAGYGRRFVADSDTVIATIPIGYGDGVRRALTNNCDVLIAGRRFPLVGTVSMDNITVEVGTDHDIEVGMTATLIGRSGAERQTAEDIARRIGTINYEILCGISPRVPRQHHRDGAPA